MSLLHTNRQIDTPMDMDKPMSTDNQLIRQLEQLTRQHHAKVKAATPEMAVVAHGAL